MITLDEVKLFNLRNFIEPDGNLVPIESGHDIPFDIKRIFYVHNVKNQDDRGKHSHLKTKQVLICLSGEVKVVCNDGKNKQSYTLSKPNQALYIPEMIWDEQTYKSNDSVLLVLANTHYDINDYIEDYEEFIMMKEDEWKQ
tara:strand:- start:29 stop:451 length:423 start_codon:yes stop_codon:yes gene_type:complete